VYVAPLFPPHRRRNKEKEIIRDKFSLASNVPPHFLQITDPTGRSIGEWFVEPSALLSGLRKGVGREAGRALRI